MTENASLEALEVFKLCSSFQFLMLFAYMFSNLKEVLYSPPLRNKVVLGVDPGYAATKIGVVVSFPSLLFAMSVMCLSNTPFRHLLWHL